MSVKNRAIRMMFDLMELPTCEEVEQFAYDYLDGALDAKTMKAVKRHLKACKNCQKFTESYHRVITQVRPVTPPPLGTEFREKMFEFLRQHRGTPAE